MYLLATSLIIVGTLLLLAGYQTACIICANTRHIGWRWLRRLIFAFVTGYLSVLALVLYQQTVDVTVFALCLILFGGSIFVYMVVSYSYSTIEQLQTLVREEKYNALHDPLTSLPNRKYCI